MDVTAQYIAGVLEFANVFISLFVLIYAWSFLKQTSDVKDRKPWVLLFIAAIIFFLFKVVGVLGFLNLVILTAIKPFLESVFIALILFVFIFQFNLILKSDLILITRKIVREEQERVEINEKTIRSHILSKTKGSRKKEES